MGRLCAVYPPPKSYPPGFPILLAPIYYIFGLSLIAFKIEMCLFLLILFVLIFIQSRGVLPDRYRLVYLLLFALNPWLSGFKQSILSEIPFSLVVYGSVLVLSHRPDRAQVRTSICLTVLFFFAFLIRTVGVVLLPAFLAYDLWRNKSLSHKTIVVTLSTIVLVFASMFVFRGGSSYLDQFRNWSPYVIVSNLRHYLQTLRDFWPHVPSFTYVRDVLYLLSGALALWGFVLTLCRGLSFIEFFAFFYLAMLLCWPAQMGLRSLLPVLPLYLLYVLLGMDAAIKMLKTVRGRSAVSLLLGVLVAVSYIACLRVIVDDLDAIPDGPQMPEAVHMFSYIRENTPHDSVFAFRKPRSLALFAERKATDHPTRLDDPIVIEYFNEVGVDYVVVDRESIGDQRRLLPFLGRHSQHFQQVFGNQRFLVLRFEKEN